MAKSANGQGNFYQRNPKGPWYFRISLKAPDGTTKRKQFGPFRTKTDARLEHDRLRDQVKRGEVSVDSNAPTVAEFLHGWMAGLTVNRKPSTAAFYRCNMERYVIPHLGSMRLDKLTGSRLTQLYSALLVDSGFGNPLSPTTVRHVHTTLATALQQAVKEGLLHRSPTDAATAPTAASSRATARTSVQAWTPEQARRFLEFTKDDPLHALWRLALTTGRRRGELVGLRWRNVDFDKASIRIVESRSFVSEAGVGIIEGSPKTSASAKPISLDPVTLEALRRHRKTEIENRMALGIPFSVDHHVFTKADGTGLHPARVSKRFRLLNERSGLPRLKMHGLRHTMATNALADGVPIKAVSERLGHASVNITLSAYTHVTPQHDEQAAAQIAALYA